MKDTKAKTMKTKTKTRETVVAEPEMVYGWGGAVQCGSMLYFVPKKDRSFFEDMARARGWSMGEGDIQKVKAAAPAKKAKKLSRLEESIQQVERGEVFEASSAEEMCDQILGKGWREKNKAKSVAPAKTAKKLSRVETVSYEPNACTVRAMKDALAGRVHHAKDAEDLLKQVGIGQKAKAKTAPAKKKDNQLKVCYSRMPVPAKKAKKLSGLEKAIQEVERGEVWEYASSDDMFDQILGKGWRTK